MSKKRKKQKLKLIRTPYTTLRAQTIPDGKKKASKEAARLKPLLEEMEDVIPDPDLLPSCRETGRCGACDSSLSFDGEWSVWKCPEGHDNYQKGGTDHE